MKDIAIGPDELRTIPFFEGFPEQDLRSLLARSRVVRFTAGDPIVKRGDRDCTMYMLLTGRGRVEVGGRYHDLQRGDFLGEMSVLSRKPRMATVTATEDLEAIEIDCVGDIDVFLMETPALGVGMLKILVERLREVEERLDAWMGIHRP